MLYYNLFKDRVGGDTMWDYLLVVFLILFVINTFLLEFQLGVCGYSKFSASVIPCLYVTLFLILGWVETNGSSTGALFGLSQIFVGYLFYSSYEAGTIALKKNKNNNY